MINNKKAKILIICGTIFIVLTIIIWQIFWFKAWQNSDLIFYGIKINKIKVDGLDIESANLFIKAETTKALENNIIEITFDDLKQSIKAIDFAGYDLDESIIDAYNTGRTGSIIENYLTMAWINIFGRNIKLDPTIDMQILKDEINLLSQTFYIPAQNAQIVSFDPNALQGNRLTIINEVLGRQIDIEQTAESIIQTMLSGKSSSEAFLMDKNADITAEILNSMDTNPISSEMSFRDITIEQENSILQIIGAGRYEILNPGDEISIIEFSGQEDYIYFVMEDDSINNDFEEALCNLIPTQIYIAGVLAEIDVLQRQKGNINRAEVTTGTDTIINKSNDMILKNNLNFPIIIYIGYKKQGAASQLFCNVYRPPMDNATLLRSVIRNQDDKTFVDIKRIYVDNRGNTTDWVLIETFSKDD